MLCKCTQGNTTSKIMKTAETHLPFLLSMGLEAVAVEETTLILVE